MEIDALRALRHRNFRLYFCGQSVSLIGTWITRLATSWLVYRLTHSSFLLGVITFAGQIPTFVAAPAAGVWIDRWDRRRTLLVTQFLAAVQSLSSGFKTANWKARPYRAPHHTASAVALVGGGCEFHQLTRLHM